MRLNQILPVTDVAQHIIDGKITAKNNPDNKHYVIFCYTPQVQFNRLWDDVTRLCRGLVVRASEPISLGKDATADQWAEAFDDAEVCGMGISKFFTVQQTLDAINLIDDDENITVSENVDLHMQWPAVTTDKLDGAMGVIYYDHDAEQARVATKGSFSSDEAKLGNMILDEKYDGGRTLYEAAQVAGFPFNPVAEIINKDNDFHVCQYTYTDLVVLGGMRIDTPVSADNSGIVPSLWTPRVKIENTYTDPVYSGLMGQVRRFPEPMQYETETLEAATRLPYEPNREGVVVCVYDPEHPLTVARMYKIKFNEFLALRGIREKLNSRSQKKVLQTIDMMPVTVWAQDSGQAERVKDACIEYARQLGVTVDDDNPLMRRFIERVTGILAANSSQRVEVAALTSELMQIREQEQTRPFREIARSMSGKPLLCSMPVKQVLGAYKKLNENQPVDSVLNRGVIARRVLRPVL